MNECQDAQWTERKPDDREWLKEKQESTYRKRILGELADAHGM